MEQPLVSVVITAYNTAHGLLEEAVESVLRQTCRALDVIVVDDGSAREMAWVSRRYGDRLRYVRKENGGPASARNLGIRLSRGAYVAFLDGDDVWEPHKLERQLARLVERPRAGLVYTAIVGIDEQGRVTPGPRPKGGPEGRVFEPLFRGNFITTSTVLVRRDSFADAGVFDECRELIAVEDYDMWLRLSERLEVAYVAEPLVRYRLHEAGISRDAARSYLGEKLVVERAIARRGAGNPWMRRAYRRRMAGLFFAWGHECFSANRLSEARARLWAGLTRRPWSLKAWGWWAATFLGTSLIRAVRRVRGTAPPDAGPRPQRIMHLNQSLGMGGIETLILQLCARLDRAAYAPSVCVLEGGGPLAVEFEAAGVPVHVMKKGRGVDWRLPVRLAQLVRREGIDILHTHNTAAWFYGVLAARLSGLPVVHTEHTSPSYHARRWRKIEKALSLATDRISAVSGSVARVMTEEQGIAANKVRVVHNGIEASLYGGAADGAALKAALGIPRSAPVVGNVARLFPNKDHGTLLRAFKRVVERVSSATLLIAGEGPLRGEVEAEVRRLQLSGTVHLLGNRRDIPALLRVFDLFVLSSVKEGLPMALLEAMAAGKPVVATEVDGNPELVVHEGTGLLVPPGNPDALAEAICRLLQDQGAAQRMGRQGRERVRRLFTFERMADAYQDVYASVARRP